MKKIYIISSLLFCGLTLMAKSESRFKSSIKRRVPKEAYVIPAFQPNIDTLNVGELIMKSQSQSLNNGKALLVDNEIFSINDIQQTKTEYVYDAFENLLEIKTYDNGLNKITFHFINTYNKNNQLLTSTAKVLINPSNDILSTISKTTYYYNSDNLLDSKAIENFNPETGDVVSVLQCFNNYDDQKRLIESTERRNGGLPTVTQYSYIGDETKKVIIRPFSAELNNVETVILDSKGRTKSSYRTHNTFDFDVIEHISETTNTYDDKQGLVITNQFRNWDKELQRFSYKIEIEVNMNNSTIISQIAYNLQPLSYDKLYWFPEIPMYTRTLSFDDPNQKGYAEYILGEYNQETEKWGWIDNGRYIYTSKPLSKQFQKVENGYLTQEITKEYYENNTLKQETSLNYSIENGDLISSFIDKYDDKGNNTYYEYHSSWGSEKCEYGEYKLSHMGYLPVSEIYYVINEDENEMTPDEKTEIEITDDGTIMGINIYSWENDWVKQPSAQRFINNSNEYGFEEKYIDEDNQGNPIEITERRTITLDNQKRPIRIEAQIKSGNNTFKVEDLKTYLYNEDGTMVETEIDGYGASYYYSTDPKKRPYELDFENILNSQFETMIDRVYDGYFSNKCLKESLYILHPEMSDWFLHKERFIEDVNSVYSLNNDRANCFRLEIEHTIIPNFGRIVEDKNCDGIISDNETFYDNKVTRQFITEETRELHSSFVSTTENLYNLSNHGNWINIFGNYTDYKEFKIDDDHKRVYNINTIFSNDQVSETITDIFNNNNNWSIKNRLEKVYSYTKPVVIETRKTEVFYRNMPDAIEKTKDNSDNIFYNDSSREIIYKNISNDIKNYNIYELSSGREMAQGEITNSLDVSFLPQGLYAITIDGETVKFFKK